MEKFQFQPDPDSQHWLNFTPPTWHTSPPPSQSQPSTFSGGPAGTSAPTVQYNYTINFKEKKNV